MADRASGADGIAMKGGGYYSLATVGANWSESMLGGDAHTPLSILAWMLSVAAGLGIIVGSIFLMPAVTALVGSLFVDDIALVGPKEKIRDRLAAWKASKVTTMIIGTVQPEAVRLLAELVL